MDACKLTVITKAFTTPVVCQVPLMNMRWDAKNQQVFSSYEWQIACVAGCRNLLFWCRRSLDMMNAVQRTFQKETCSSRQHMPQVQSKPTYPYEGAENETYNKTECRAMT